MKGKINIIDDSDAIIIGSKKKKDLIERKPF